MTWGTLQTIELAALALMAVGTQALVARARKPFLAGLEQLAGGSARSLATISDAVAGLIYLAFGAAVLPFDGVGPAGPQQLEDMLDTIALFALLVAFIQVVSLYVLHRVANHLEPWPPKSTAAAAS